MNEEKLKEMIESSAKLESRIKFYIHKKLLINQNIDFDEIKGHLEKSMHNLSFVSDTIKQGYLDWAITGCYYAVYHAILALILSKEYSSKNHDATLCILIREFYKKGINEEEIKLVNKFFLNYHDLLFYTDSKIKREDASYSTNYKFNEKTVEELRMKAILLINKIKEMIKNE
jgi:uncharacterized protein (UPF0332 family)